MATTGLANAVGAAILGVPEVVARHAAERPQRIAASCGPLTRTWAELDAAANRVARALDASGTPAGARVALLAEPSLEYLEVFLGALRAGACVVPLPTSANVATLARILDDCRPSALFVSGSQRTCLPTLRDAVIALDADWPAIVFDFDGGLPGVADYRAWRDREPATALERPVALDSLFNIIYSSGTTGMPKGIPHSHRARAGCAGLVAALDFGSESALLVTTGMYSNYTLMAWLIALYCGGRTVLMPKFAAGACLELVSRQAVTDAWLVPVQIQRVLDAPEFATFRPGRPVRLWTAGSPLAAEYKRRLVDCWPGGVCELYGQTEGAPASLLDMRAAPAKLASVGAIVAGGAVEAIGPDDVLLPRGCIGELVGATPAMMDGYYRRPEETARIEWRHPDGRRFLRSGDLGYIDADGYVYLAGRAKDLIISGGANVYPADLEDELYRHPDVRECAVIGVPSLRWGETPVALVVLRHSASIDASSLRSWLNARVGKTQRVAAVVLRDTLPRGSMDKVLKRALRDEYRDAGYGDSDIDPRG